MCVHPKRKKHSRKKPKPRCECLAPHKQCSSGCVDVRSDPHNCGACGHMCPSGQVCSHGLCVLHCPAGQTACGGACVNLQTDPHNCDTCGKVCPTPTGGTAGCVAGACHEMCVMAGQTVCAGACVNLLTDAGNCNSCGHKCPSGQVCSGGGCVLNCPSGETVCGTSCVNLQTDPANCNGCGTTCPPPTGGVATCAGGSCGQSCTTDGETVCDGVCVDTQTNAANCGGCGTDCAGDPSGHICVSGNCGCAQDGDCPTGSYCGGAGVCVSKSPLGAACVSNDVCQSGMCTPTNASDSICCGVPCTAAAPSTCGLNGNCDPSGSSCALYPSGTVCGSASCSNGTAHAAATCDGNGTCIPAVTTNCAPFACAGTVCGTTCSASGSPPNQTSDGCAPGYYCDTVSVNPFCSNTLKAPGAACVNNYECADGTCDAGVCN